MQSLFQLMPSYEIKKSSVNSERASIIKELMDRINIGRPCVYTNDNGKKITVQPVTARAIAVRVGYLKKNSDLYYLLAICKQAPNFSKCFFYHTKSQKVLA